MIRDAFLLDVNVPMYAYGQDHAYRDACRWVMHEIAAGKLAAAIDCEIVQEILHRFGALGRWHVAVSMATDLMTVVPTVLPVSAADATVAIGLFGTYAPRGITSRVAIHVAVMQNNGLREIVSTDRHFDQIAGITWLDPSDL